MRVKKTSLLEKKEQNIFVCERFLTTLFEVYLKYIRQIREIPDKKSNILILTTE